MARKNRFRELLGEITEKVTADVTPVIEDHLEKFSGSLYIWPLIDRGITIVVYSRYEFIDGPIAEPIRLEDLLIAKANGNPEELNEYADLLIMSAERLRAQSIKQ